MMYAVVRLFLLRVPSECAPLEVDGPHSQITLEDDAVTITLYRRKNAAAPSVLKRHCVCLSEGRTLCGVCALRDWMARAVGAQHGRVFKRSAARFLHRLRADALQIGLHEAHRLGSHSLRRGMARDIVLAGGSLATLLRAGQWRSKSFMVYLQEQTLDEQAVAQLVIDHSDDDQ